MKLNSLEPNAHYDLAHGIPAVLEKDNDGSVIYRVAPPVGAWVETTVKVSASFLMQRRPPRGIVD